MSDWQPTPEQAQQYATEGYFILRNVLPHDAAVEIRGVIKNILLAPEPDVRADVDPMDPMGDSPQARAARFRKLSNFAPKNPLIWYNVYAGERLAAIARYFLGDDLLLKFNSCFVKPARTGSATPWHQDNGLWRDGETEPFNFWMALDPATRANGCLQFIPGSQQTEIVPHVLYLDSIHGELPRERVRAMVGQHGLHHIELAPGDAVFWHSSLWHYSPPNTSDQGRIGIAGVYTTPAIVERGKPYWPNLLWTMRAGQRCSQFPPDAYPMNRTLEKPPAYLKAD
ncbi:MAG: phytanoyl-CoA dioxygenase family protein [Chloroflexi bacterium]|nr:phytanoyl-CoA dioxygenase family protein [Chloroflexota bacterium]